MKIYITTLSLFYISILTCFTQITKNDYQLHPLESINAENEDFSDLLFLKELWADKQYILLGEQSHGEGATFEARVRLIKFLHQELDS